VGQAGVAVTKRTQARLQTLVTYSFRDFPQPVQANVVTTRILG
jgi:hypothetical protein